MVRQSRHPSICIGTQSIDLGSCFRFRIHLALFRWVSAFALLFLALPCSAQLAKSGWPKFRGNAGNSGLSVGANVLPNEMWSKLIQQGGGIATSPAIGADGTVYVCGGGSVYSLGATGGGVNWSFTPPSGGTFQATPAIGIDGTVFIGSVNPNSSSGNTFYALDGLKGTVKWSFTGSPSSEGFVSSPAIGLDGTIYAATTMGHVYALNPSTGAVNWTTTTSSGEQFLSSPASDNNDQQHYGMIYVGSHSGNLYAISKLDGSISWTFTAGGAIDSSPAMGGAGVVVGSNDGNIYDITLAGTKFWSVATGSRVYSSPAIGPDGTIYVGSEDKNVYAITGMGTHLWTFTTGAAVDGSPAIGADGTIYIGPGDGCIYALNGATGARKWSFQTTSSSGSPSLGADGRLYVLSGTSMIGLESVHVTSLSVLPNTVLGGTSVQGSVVMNMSAPVGGAYIAVASDNGAASPPGSMIIAQGQNHIQFTVNTHGVDYDQTANISATPGINKSVPLKVLMATLKSFVLIPSTLNELDSAEARVTLNGPAGPLGVDVFGSSNTKFAIINPKKPPQAHIGYGSTTASFGVDTIPVDTQTLATINAYANGSMNAILTINPATLASVTVSPAAVAGGNTATGTINLNLPAGPSGTVVSLSSDNAAAQVPGTVTVPAGTTTTPAGPASPLSDTVPVDGVAPETVAGFMLTESNDGLLTVSVCWNWPFMFAVIATYVCEVTPFVATVNVPTF